MIDLDACIRELAVAPSDGGDLGLDFADLDPVRLAFVVASGGIELAAGDIALLVGDRATIALPPRELADRLAALDHRVREARAESGDHALWLACGELDGAPLWLMPVALDDTRLVAVHDRVPRLGDRARELALADSLDLADVLAAAERAALEAEVPFARTARLVVHSFAPRDLAADAALLGARGPLAWLVGDGPPPSPPMARGDRVLAPLDADAQQRGAISAAVAGASFVLAGAPGTGKSQTIANVVAACATAGQSVLVASERPATLAALRDRLAAVGLGELVLALDAGDDGRARVAAALARALDRPFRPASGPSSDARVDELAARLDAHAAALHRDGDLGMSVHDVLGRLVELRVVPRAELAERDAPVLDRARFEERRRAVAQLAAAAAGVAPVAAHPWRTSTLAVCDRDRAARVERALDDASRVADELATALAEVDALVPGIVARTPDQLRALGAFAQLAALSPRPGAELFAPMAATDAACEAVARVRSRGGGVLDGRDPRPAGSAAEGRRGRIEAPRDPATLVAIAERHRALVAELDEQLGGAAARTAFTAIDLDEHWRQLARWTERAAPLRFLGLRATRAELRAAAGDAGRLDDDAALRTALEAALAERACREALVAAAQPARRWLGALAGAPAAPQDAVLALDLPAIDAAIEWTVELRRAFDAVAIRGGDGERRAAWRALVAQVAAAPDADGPFVLASVHELAAFARLADAIARWEPALDELAAATGVPAGALAATTDHLATARTRVATFGAARDALPAWTRYVTARQIAREAGVVAAVAAIERGDLDGDALVLAWERATLLAWLDAAVAAAPALARFDGAAHHTAVARFVDLDRADAARARSLALAAVAERVPALPADEAEAVERAQLRRAAAATGERGASRALLAELPRSLVRLAPCIAATPHAIARHLDPALPAFDVVVIDDAGGLAIARAAGVLARGRAAIVVGDPRHAEPGSVLAATRAARWPEVDLATQHRAVHHDVFAIANRRWYGERVAVLPSARPAGRELGACWRAASEAELVDAAIAEAGAREAGARPRSIAIVAATRELARRLDARLADARAIDPHALARVDAGTAERFRGDERDVAIVVVDERALELGAAWLAIATTRAREQLAIVSSVEPERLVTDATPAQRDLAAVLAFARAGGGAREHGEPTGPIADAIARALGERGWIVHHRVGCGTPTIELAVADPDEPARYAIAIELDGGIYAATSAARDRDRARGERLARLGWRTHRIWTFDWWRDPEREVQRAHGAIVAAIAAGRQRTVRRCDGESNHVVVQQRRTAVRSDRPAAGRPTGDLASGSGPAVAVRAASADEPVRSSVAIGRYAVAVVPAGRRAPDDLFAPRYAGELAKLVERVLAAEAPVHLEVLARRVGAYFGIGRVTERVAAHVRVAVAGRGRWGDEHDVVWRLDQDPRDTPPVRVAGADARRDIVEVPLAELAGAARVVVERAGAIGDADLVRDTARLLGFARLTDRVSARVVDGIAVAVERGLVASANGTATLPGRATGHGPQATGPEA